MGDYVDQLISSVAKACTYNLSDEEGQKYDDRIKSLKTLLSGCPNHPSYRAKRRPTALCNTCLDMYVAKHKIDRGDFD